MNRNYIGENIRRYRERSNLTQQQLADKVGVSWEMVSRYERSASSPLKKLEQLSDALQVSKSQLLEEHIPEGGSILDIRVPLFTSIPSPARFQSSQTNYYYSCPEWISKQYSEVIALDSKLTHTNIPNFLLNGILFVSRDSTPKHGEFYISRGYESLELKRYEGESTENILGKLVAQEVKY